MYRCNARQTRIVRIQSRRHCRQARHQPINSRVLQQDMFQQLFDLGTFAYNKTPVAPLDQRRSSK